MTRFGLLIAVMVGCGPAPNPHQPGKPCTNEPPECLDEGTKIICDNGAWLAYPCDGTFSMPDGGTLIGRCVLPGAPQQCLHPVPAAGDSCPVSFEGRLSRCMSASAIGQCQGGMWVSCPQDRFGCEDFLLNANEADGVSTSFHMAPDSGCSLK